MSNHAKINFVGFLTFELKYDQILEFLEVVFLRNKLENRK